MFLLFVLSLVTAFTAAPVLAGEQPKVIYGEDNRQEYYKITDPKLKQIADATAALFTPDSIRKPIFGRLGRRYRLRLRSTAASLNLCPEERFRDQETGASCSGVLVAPNLILTAGHCVSQETCVDSKFVFGFAVKEPGKAPSKRVHRSLVYQCKKVIAHELTYDGKEGNDFAVVQLDRNVKGRTPIKLNRRLEGVDMQAKLTLMGHPSGLPFKYADGATVRSNEHAGFFVATTDSFAGNSGSPVINSTTHELEGILVRGETDFVEDVARGCNYVNRCAEDECRGEDVTRVSSFSSYIPALY